VLELKLRDAGDDLRRAIEMIIAARSREARLVFPQASTIDTELVETLATLLAGAPQLTRLVLVHASAGMRFVASTLTLKLPRIAFEVELAEQPKLDRGTATLAARTWTVRLTDHREPDDALAAALGPVTEWKLRAIIIVLAAAEPLTPELGDALAATLAKMKELQRVALVHPDPALADVAAKVGTACPKLTVTVFATEPESAIPAS
jgi:hypothetical protein